MMMMMMMQVCTDSWVFRLHYRLTTTVMLAFSIVISASQYVGNPIDCIHTNDIPEDVVNTYCWIHSTYTIPSAFWKKTGFEVCLPHALKVYFQIILLRLLILEWTRLTILWSGDITSIISGYHSASSSR